MNKSESIGKLAEALAKAQGAMGAAHKESSNPFFKSKYADLASVIDAIKQPLADNGLAFVQCTDFDDSHSVIVETMLMHQSGEWISSRLRMTPVKVDPQSTGSCVTYAKRYGLQAMAGIPSADDDAEDATRTGAPLPTAKVTPMPSKVKQAIKPKVAETVTGDPAEGDLTGIGSPKADDVSLGKVIHAFASIGFDMLGLQQEYGKNIDEWTMDDIAEARKVYAHLKAEFDAGKLGKGI